MLWVTSASIHLDRVASPWLIRRFIDRDASFGFLRPGDAVPVDAIPFAWPDAELGPHDQHGSAFRKILHKYGPSSSELNQMAVCLEAGIALALGQPLPDLPDDLLAHATSMASFSEAMAVLHGDDDDANLAASAHFYDAVYVSLWAAGQGAPALTADVRARIAALRGARDWTVLLPPWTPPQARTVTP
jgi:hypothetical protein